MSAIWGLISDSLLPGDDINDRMTSVYRERCKIDRYDYVRQEEAYFAAGIQYITSESEHETMPVYDQDRQVLFTADCLLDNRQELLKELQCPADLPDGSLMYRAYLHWGMDCLIHFRGLFSLAIYDRTKETLYLAADQTASRCLYYYRTPSAVAFSTLIDPIRSVYPNIPHNEWYLKDYLTAPGLMPNIVSQETPYQGIYKLEPGTYLTITRDTVKETKYWDPSVRVPGLSAGKHRKHTEEYGRKFKELYNECVIDAMRCNGEIGIAMSSGFDSATVGVQAAIHLDKQNRKLRTYTYIPYEKETVHHDKNNVMNEQKDVEAIAAMYPNMIPHFLNNNGKNCLEDLPDILKIMEIPFKAFVNLPNLCEIYRTAASQGCKVLLTGQCGNSTVSNGYIDNVLYDLYERKHYIKFLLWLNRYSKTVRESRKKALRGCFHYFEYAKKAYNKEKFEYKPTNEFLKENIMEGYPLEERYRNSGMGTLEKLPVPGRKYREYLYKSALYTYMGELETKLGLAYGIVIRDPTKDMRMLSFCYHLPYPLFAYRGVPRWLIRGNLRGLLPDHILDQWMRYGVQNADYLSRILRDKTEVITELKDVLETSFFRKWVDHGKITEYLNTDDDDLILRTYYTFDAIVYLYILSRFVAKG